MPATDRLDDEQRATLLLGLLPGIGSRRLSKLILHFGSAAAVFQASLAQLAAARLPAAALSQLQHWRQATGLQHPYLDKVNDWLAAGPHQLLIVSDPAYPTQLKQLYDPPVLLYLRGDAELLNQVQIALVGSRQPSPAGLDTAYAFARELSCGGLVPVSGLALGIDAKAHEGGLAGLGLTVAVLGTGVDQVYPRRHQALADAIVEAGGVLVSEYPLGTAPRAQNFPRRNRIISGLSVATLVVEASLNSGSLITAREAMEQGREVFAIPGSIHSPMSKGCHALIRQGAVLVESVADIYQELSGPLSALAFSEQPYLQELHSQEQKPHEQHLQKQHSARVANTCSPVAADLGTLPDELRQLMAHMDFDRQSVDSLVERSKLSAGEVMTALLELELLGWVSVVNQGYQRIR